MGFSSFGRIISAFFNQLFRWLFWNNTGQKILFIIVIAFILVAFVKLGEVAAVEPDNFANYVLIDFDGTISGRNVNVAGKIIEGNYNLYYLELNPYNYYVVSLVSSSGQRFFRSGFSNSLDLDTVLSNFDYDVLQSGSSYDREFSGNNGYKYFVFCSNNTAPTLYYNAYPFEISTPISYPKLSYNHVGGFVYLDSNENYQGLYMYPVSKGVAYRMSFTETIPSSSSKPIYLGFTDNLDWFSQVGSVSTPSYTHYVSTIPSDLRGLDKVDFVAPSDGYIICPYLNNNYVAGLFSSTLYISLDTDTTNTAVNQSTNAINNVNDSLTDPNISEDDSDYVLPESGVNDIAESGFANIFDKLRTAFTQESSGQGLVVQVPFTDKSFTISKNTVFGNANLGIVGTLINSFWYFVISLWIVKDIAHKINLIKSGNIELAQTSNIKEDLL